MASNSLGIPRLSYWKHKVWPHLFSRLLSHTKFINSSMQTTRNFSWLCHLAAMYMIFLHFSLVWTLFTFGFVKMAWPSTLLNQLSFCLARHRNSNLCLVSSLSMSLGQSFQFLIRSWYSVQHSIPTSQWNLTPKLYPVPDFKGTWTHVHVRYMLSPVRLSVVCRLSFVTLVYPTQAVVIFGNISAAFGTLAIHLTSTKNLRRSSQGNPSVGGVIHNRGSQI